LNKYQEFISTKLIKKMSVEERNLISHLKEFED